MSKSNEAAYIAKAQRDLVRSQRIAKLFASQYRQYRARKSDLAQPYKIMAQLALARVRRLKRSIQEEVAYQKKLEQFTLRITELKSKLPK